MVRGHPLCQTVEGPTSPANPPPPAGCNTALGSNVSQIVDRRSNTCSQTTIKQAANRRLVARQVACRLGNVQGAAQVPVPSGARAVRLAGAQSWALACQCDIRAVVAS